LTTFIIYNNIKIVYVQLLHNCAINNILYIKYLIMARIKISELIEDAKQKKYAIGYFESWDIESTLAIAKAAEKMNSPVILGFSGIYLPNPLRIYKSSLKLYADIVNSIATEIKVPAATIFNESPFYESVIENINYGYDLVMFTDENLEYDELIKKIKKLVKSAHEKGVKVEGEVNTLIGAGNYILDIPEDVKITEPKIAKKFVEDTNIDFLAVNLGQAHMHGRKKMHLDIRKLDEIKKLIDIPLVLHGMSSIAEEDIKEAIKHGITKINVSSKMKQIYFKTIKEECKKIGQNYNPYIIIGSGFKEDIITKANINVQKFVEKTIDILGCSGKA